MDRLMTFSFQAQQQQTTNQKTPSSKVQMYKFDKVAQFQQEINQLKQLSNNASSKGRSKSTLDPQPNSTSNYSSNKQYQTITEKQQTSTSPFKVDSKQSIVPPKATIEKKKTDKGTQTQNDVTEERINQMQKLVNSLLEQKNEILEKIQTASKEKNDLKNEMIQMRQQENELKNDIRELNQINDQLLEKEKYYQLNIQQFQQKLSEVRGLNENKYFYNFLGSLSEFEQQELAKSLINLFKQQGNRLEVAFQLIN